MSARVERPGLGWQLAPWLLLGVSVAVLAARAWLVQQGALSDEAIEVDAFSLKLRFWCTGCVPLLVVGGLGSFVRPARETRLSRFGWAWATWSAFAACVPPRIANFFHDGAVDDAPYVYFPAALIAIAGIWTLDRTARGLGRGSRVFAVVAMEALAAMALFRGVGGYGSDAVAEASLTTMVIAAGAAIMLHLMRPDAK